MVREIPADGGGRDLGFGAPLMRCLLGTELLSQFRKVSEGFRKVAAVSFQKPAYFPEMNMNFDLGEV